MATDKAERAARFRELIGTTTREASAKLLDGLVRDTAAAFLTVRAVLADLPLQMLIPALDDDPVLAAASLSRAWELADEEPLPAATRETVREMITAWLTAFEGTTSMTLAGLTAVVPWRARIAEDALRRTRAAERDLRRHLAGGAPVAGEVPGHDLVRGCRPDHYLMPVAAFSGRFRHVRDRSP